MNPLHVVNNAVHLPAVKNVVSTSKVQYVLCFFTIFKNVRAGPLAMKFYPELHDNSSQYLYILNYLVFNLGQTIQINATPV